MVMDLIIITVGLGVLLVRDVYKAVRRKRKEKKLRKKLKLQAFATGGDPDQLECISDSRGRIIGRPIAPPRTSRNHPDRPVTLDCASPSSARPSQRPRRTNGAGNASGSGTRGGGRNCRRWTTREGERYHHHYGLDYDEDQERIVDRYQSQYGRMPTPPPAYEAGPNPLHVASASEHPLPPPFEHAYTAGASERMTEAQRKAEGAQSLAGYGQRPPMPPERVSTQF